MSTLIFEPMYTHVYAYKSKFWMRYVFIILALVCKISYGQTQEHSEEVTIIGAFEPEISGADKLNLNPKIEKQLIELPRLDYPFRPLPFSVQLHPKPLKPAAIRGEKLSVLSRNFIKAGMGNYYSPYFEFSANSLRSEDYLFGLRYKHFSSAGNIRNYAKSAYSNNHAEIFGTKFFRGHSLQSRVYYRHNVLHQYGFQPDDFPAIPLQDKDIRQRYQLAGAHVALSSNYMEEDKLNHTLELEYYHFSNIHNSREQNWQFNSCIDRRFENPKQGRFYTLGVKLRGDHYINKDSVNSNTSFLIQAEPFFQTRFAQYQLYAGLNANITVDSINSVNFYPMLKADIEIIPKALYAKAGIKGAYTRISLREMSNINPYINSIISLAYKNNTFELFGQLKGKILRGFDFDVQVSNAFYTEYPFFINDTASLFFNTFDIVYDKINLLHARAGFAIQLRESFKLFAKANYYNYSMDKELKPWHRPAYDIDFSVMKSIKERVYFRGGISIFGKSYAKTVVNTLIVPEEIKGYVHLQANVEYRYTKKLSFYIYANNIGNTANMRWYGYPVQKTGIIAGLSYSF